MKGYTSAHPLFDTPGEGAPDVPLNSSVEEWDQPRLSQQHAAILAALEDGPKSGPYLAQIAIRYSARLEELKKAGHPWLKRAIGGGQYLYWLVDRGEKES